MNRFASIIIIFLSTVLFFLSITGGHGLLQLRKIDTEVKQLEDKNQSLSQEIVELQNKIFGLQKSDEVLEQKAREELGLAKPNEIVYIFPSAQRGTSAKNSNGKEPAVGVEQKGGAVNRQQDEKK